MNYRELVDWKARLMNTLNEDHRIVPGDWSEFVSESVKFGCLSMAIDMQKRLESYAGDFDWGDK